MLWTRSILALLFAASLAAQTTPPPKTAPIQTGTARDGQAVYSCPPGYVLWTQEDFPTGPKKVRRWEPSLVESVPFMILKHGRFECRTTPKSAGLQDQ
jgi:hypothetical protein